MEKESKRKTKVATVLVCDTHATPPLCRDKHYPGIILMYPVLYPYCCSATVYSVLYTGTVVLSTVPCFCTITCRTN